jgi:hypothetical protein
MKQSPACRRVVCPGIVAFLCRLLLRPQRIAGKTCKYQVSAHDLERCSVKRRRMHAFRQGLVVADRIMGAYDVRAVKE